MSKDKKSKAKSKSKLNYFDAFSKQAEYACKEADLLDEVIENFTTAEAIQDYLPRAHQIEHDADVVNHEILTAIDVDFITPIDRDDIITLAQALDDIVDSIEDVIQRFYMFDVHFMHHDAAGFSKLIRKECNALSVAMEEFHNFKKSGTFRKSIIKVNDIEEEADGFYVEMMRNLFTVDRENPTRVIVWMEIFERMEDCCDNGERVADTMSSILLKNS